MWKPHRITDGFESRVESSYKANSAMNQGALVSIDLTDTSAVGNTIGYAQLISGSLALATVSTAGDSELGVLIAQVMDGGRPLFPDQILGLAKNYMTIPTGLNAPVYRTVKGDQIGTTEYVGYLAGDSTLTGYINTASTGNFGAQCEIYQGRYRLLQGGGVPRAKWVGNTQQAGVALALFEVL